VRDLIVVQLVPDTTDDVPTNGRAIRKRVGEIVFNSSLVAEMQAIAAMRSVAARGDGASSVLDLRLHRIGPPPRELLEQESSMERSLAWLQRLHREGRSAAKRFVARHGADVGVRETLDIASVFADEHKPKMRVPANEAVLDSARLS